jgi:hypothetical protein
VNQILIVGNSPVCKINQIEMFDHVILGRGIFNLKNMYVKKWCTRSTMIKSAAQYKIDELYILPENYSDDDYGIKCPTLGYYAIMYFLKKNYNVKVTGITFDVSSKYIHKGSWWSKNEIRDNTRHEILKETIILKKLKNKNVISEL